MAVRSELQHQTANFQSRASTRAGFFAQGQWRFQQVTVDKDNILPISIEVVKENVPAKSFFDLQVAAQETLDLSDDGLILSPALNLKGSPDAIVTTMSSDLNDPWRKSIGPQFGYRLKHFVLQFPGKTQMELNGFPMKCEKVR